MGQITNDKYQVMNNGKVYRINDDGSFTEIGDVSNLQNEPTQKNNRKTNTWCIVSGLLFIVVALLGYALYETNNELNYLSQERYYSNNRESNMSETLSTKEDEISQIEYQLQVKDAEISQIEYQLQVKDAEISQIEYQLQVKDAEITNLQNQLPQTYYTKYPNQNVYYWAGSFIETNYKWSIAEQKVIVYMEREGYGMTEWGWVPMDCLRK